MAAKQHILIVDDETDIRELLYISISRMGYECSTASGVQEALLALKDKEFNLCLTDMNMPDGNGLQVIEYIQKNSPDLPVAMITAYGSLDTAIEAMKAGAFDYITKPIDQNTLKKLITSALKAQRPDCKQDSTDNHNSQMIGSSEQMHRLNSQINKLAKSQAPVFVHGESGSGKELVARMIHSRSNRYDAPFIPVNCGAIPSELVESELFGHVKGSFTGATENKLGMFRSAEGGTLFLDEVADLPLAMQVKLLRAVQEKAIRPVGGNEETPVDVRILSASHKDLPLEIEAGHFREDLYYRINVIELNVPSLRDRPDDIVPLAEHILNKLAERYESPVISLGDSAQELLRQHSFPGNVRELENILERAFTLTDNNILQAEDLQLTRKIKDIDFTPENNDNLSETINNDQDSSVEPQPFNPEDAFGDIEAYLENLEMKILNAALEKSRWNKTAAAELLGISFRAMRYKLKKYEIE